MTRARLRSRRTVAAGSAVLLALVGGSLAAPAHAAPVTPTVTPVDCPTAYPLSSVDADTVGEGLTVVSGTTPAPFKVQVVGVLKGGIGAGKDLIMVNLSDLPGGHVVDQGGGGWAGISGSPVYVDGQLLGALSYGFTNAPSTLMGLTPAVYMTPLLGLGSQQQPQQARGQVKLSTATRKQLAARAGTAVPSGDLKPVVTPLGVSGLSSKRIDRLQSDLSHAGRSYRAYAAGGGSPSAAGGTPTARPEAGGDFAYSLASGDFDAFGVGTTTAICGDQALAFGHYIDRAGPVSYTANNASTVTIVKDDTAGSYKLANLGAPIGTLDQDRLAGVRADLTKTADTTTVTTVMENRDTRASRTGTTDVSDQKSLSGLLPYIVFAGQDAVFDEWNDGVASSNWTITGTRAGGKPFSVTRANSWASQDDVTISPAVDIASAVDQLLTNQYEDVTVDDVTFASTLKSKFRQRHISVMSVSVNGGKFTQAKRLNVKVGDKLRIHVGMKEYRGTGTHYMLLGMTVPKKARGQVASLSVVGGTELSNLEDFGDEGCFFDGECESDSANGSLNKVISSITSAPRNNAVVAELSYDDDDEGTTVTAATTSKLDTLTVTGERDILVRIR